MFGLRIAVEPLLGHGGCSYRVWEAMHRGVGSVLNEEIASHDAESDEATAARSAA
jgi:hypothetical protein